MQIMGAPPDASIALSVQNKVRQLLTAAQNGDLAKFQELVQTVAGGQDIGKEVADVKDANERSALHFAARNGNTELCKYLLDVLQFPVDQKDSDGETPLMHAVRQGHCSTAKLFIDYGADVSAVSTELCATSLHHASGLGSTELIRMLLDHGADVSADSDAGQPLIWAAGHGRYDAAKLLLERGANPNSSGEDDITPLLAAAAADSKEIVELLLKHGANVNACAGGATALHMAADAGNAEMVHLLVSAGANVDLKDDDGAKPIMAAAARKHRSIIEYLLPLTMRDNAITDWTVDGIVGHAVGTYVQEKQTTEKTVVGEVPGQKKQFEISPEKKAKAAEAKSRGDEAFRKKDYMLAVDAYTQALDLDPTNTTLFSNRSLCWIRLGQPDHALSDATRARSLKPDWPKAWYREGAALRLLQRFEDAADAFYTGIKLDPENKELVDAFREAVEAGKRFHAAGPLNNQAAK